MHDEQRMRTSQTPDVSIEAEGILSPVTRGNLAILCAGFLLFCVLTIIDFMPDIACLTASSLMVAYLLLGPVHGIEAWLQKTRLPARMHRTAAIIVVYLVFLGMLALALLRVLPPLNEQIREFAHDIPGVISRVQARSLPSPASSEEGMALTGDSTAAHSPPSRQPAQPAASRPGRKDSSPSALVSDPADKPARWRILSGAGEQFLQKLLETYRQSVLKAGGLLLDIGASTLTGLIYSLTTLVLVFILLHDGRGLRRGMADLMPAQYEDVTAAFLHRLHVHMSAFVKAQVLVGIFSGGLMTLLLSLLHVKYALLLGVGFGAVSVLPVVGPWLGLIPITLILALTHHLDYIVQVLLWAGVFYLVKTYWLWPKMIDRRFHVHPIIFIVTFLACLKLVGVLGVVLSFPLASMLGVALDMFRESHRNHAEQA